MSFKSWKRVGMALLVVFAVAALTLNTSAAPPKDNLTVTAQTSSPGGFVPTVPGNAADQHIWFYAVCVPDTETPISETFPVDFTLTDGNNNTPQTATIHMNAVGGLGGSTTVPADFVMTDDGSTTSKQIVLNSGPLSAGQHVANVQISTDAPNRVALNHDVIHIQVTVGSGCPVSGTLCFFTDSNYSLLQDCGGNDVVDNAGGTFQIVVNNKKVAATNPGQFYYNLLWTNNTGLSQPITINLSSNAELATQGANSVHAMTFNSTGFTADLNAWNMVNQNGTPCGPSGPCTVNVSAGDTLFVTWHLKYSRLGQAVPSGIPSSCSQNGPPVISATGVLIGITVADGPQVELGRCTSTGAGYLKK